MNSGFFPSIMESVTTRPLAILAHADRLRKEMKTEEAHRIETQIRELEEQLLFFL